ncbi:MAG: DNA-processing protein DprA [Lachnospiraceae bacterium]|nr:DNA-processing protein DprA [Lachnospiraceae bacterium]
MSQYTIEVCKQENIEFPDALLHMKKCPSLLYYMGDISILKQQKSIAVVGSRNASLKGLDLSYQTGKAVCEAGFNLVNGLAIGCDTEALKGALSIGGKCIAVMPCGLDQIVPKENKWLVQEILKNKGCLISEYAISVPPRRYQYVERDKIQSGISSGVVIIEAEEQSGTMHTADFALKQYKRLACYSEKLLEKASGNRALACKNEVKILHEKDDLNLFFKEVREDKLYEQMSLF